MRSVARCANPHCGVLAPASSGEHSTPVPFSHAPLSGSLATLSPRLVWVASPVQAILTILPWDALLLTARLGRQIAARDFVLPSTRRGRRTTSRNALLPSARHRRRTPMRRGFPVRQKIAPSFLGDFAPGAVAVRRSRNLDLRVLAPRTARGVPARQHVVIFAEKLPVRKPGAAAWTSSGAKRAVGASRRRVRNVVVDAEAVLLAA